VDQYKPTGVRQQLRAALSGVSGEITQMRQRKEKLEREIRNFTQAIADGGHSKYILDDLTGCFCTSGSEREFTLEGSWYAYEEIQAGADRDAAAAG
jgi:hypothetical protein